MKNTTKTILFMAFFSLLSLFSTSPVSAFQFRSGESVNIDPLTTLNETLIVTANDINIQGKIDGDLICAGSNIKVSGLVTGDIICAGQTLVVDGKIDKNGYMFGQSIDLTKNSTVGGELLTAGQKINLAGTIQRNVQSWSQEIAFATGSAILGNLNFQTDSNYSLPHNIVGGKTSYQSFTLPNQSKFEKSGNLNQALESFGKFLNFIGYLNLFIFGAVIVLLFPSKFETISDLIRARVGQSLKWGIVIWAISTIMTFVLLISVIGWPLMLAYIPLFILVDSIARIIGSIYVGRLLIANSSIKLAFLVGFIVLAIVAQIPYFGWFIVMITILMGWGSLYLSWRKK